MRLNKYKFSQHSEDTYVFVSKGINGDIDKAVVFEEDTAHNRWNLGMGDIDMKTGFMNDAVLSGNNDARKILATTADIIKDYTFSYPEREIIFKGNSQEKINIYSILTSAFLDEILVDFDVWGLDVDEYMEPFEKGKIYAGILVKRK